MAERSNTETPFCTTCLTTWDVMAKKEHRHAVWALGCGIMGRDKLRSNLHRSGWCLTFPLRLLVMIRYPTSLLPFLFDFVGITEGCLFFFAKSGHTHLSQSCNRLTATHLLSGHGERRSVNCKCEDTQALQSKAKYRISNHHCPKKPRTPSFAFDLQLYHRDHDRAI